MMNDVCTYLYIYASCGASGGHAHLASAQLGAWRRDAVVAVEDFLGRRPARIPNKSDQLAPT